MIESKCGDWSISQNGDGSKQLILNNENGKYFMLQGNDVHRCKTKKSLEHYLEYLVNDRQKWLVAKTRLYELSLPYRLEFLNREQCKRIGKRIRKARLAKSMLRAEFAEKLDIQAYICLWELGSIPEEKTLRKISDLLEMPLSDLIEGKGGCDVLNHDVCLDWRETCDNMMYCADIADADNKYLALVHANNAYKRALNDDNINFTLITNPSNMFRYVHTLRIKDDVIDSAAIIYDLIAEGHCTIDDFSDVGAGAKLCKMLEIKQAIGGHNLVTFGGFEKIRDNPDAALLKTIEWCVNAHKLPSDYTDEQIRHFIDFATHYITDLPNRLDCFGSAKKHLEHEMNQILDIYEGILS